MAADDVGRPVLPYVAYRAEAMNLAYNRSVLGIRSRAWLTVLTAGCVFVGGATLGCGRVGFELLPASDVRPTDAGEQGDDAGGADAAMDAGRDAGARLADAGADASAPLCATACSNDHGTTDCGSGSCLLACTIGFSDCDLDPGNGCETETATTVDRCGACGTQCENDHGSSGCSEGVCTATCDSDYGDCDLDPTNGCETALTSTSACGTCGQSCTNLHGATACVARACEPSCDSGYADCDGDPDNGCETDILNDPSHCGACPNACGTNGQICVDGGCAASPCAAGLGECDDDLTVTCETDLTNDVNNCNFCRNACATLNGTPVCTGGVCDVAACDTGYDNCDGDPAACETNLTSDVDHCGACNSACTNAHGSTRCENSTCMPTCSSGWDDCDGNPDNGCEAPLTTASDCGFCNNACPGNGGTPICNAGTCDTRCDLTGSFAVHARVYATWSQTAGLNAGQGWFEWWARLDATHSGNTADVQLRLCGATVPAFTTVLVNEKNLYGYSDSLFDSGALAAQSSTLTLGDSTPDSSISLPTVTFLLGLSMSNPMTDPWPNSAAGIPTANRIDMDNDGNPGVTASFANGGGYVYPRTSSQIIGFNRADREYIAARTSFSLSGTLNGCTQASGPAVFPHIQARVLGCRRSSGSACSSTENDNMDNVSPSFSLNNGSYAMTKVTDGASCATVRAALP